jgi:hypothetical protein
MGDAEGALAGHPHQTAAVGTDQSIFSHSNQTDWMSHEGPGFGMG